MSQAHIGVINGIFIFLGGLHENFGDGQSKRLPGHNFVSRSLFMVLNWRYLLLAVFGKHSISFLSLFSQCTQCKLKKKVKMWKKYTFFSIFYLLGKSFHRKPEFFSVISKYSLKETKLRKIHFSSLIYNEYVTKIRKGAKFGLFWPFLGPKTQTPLFFFGRQVILDSQHVKLA